MLRLLRFLCGAALLWAPLAAVAQAPLDRLTIVVPASAGGGFDRTAQSLARALRKDGLARQVTIRYSPGAGGLIGVAQFENRPPDGPEVLIGGMTILGAEAANHAAVSLTDLVPLAQLYDVPLAIAVRDDSPIRSIADLTEILRSDPSRVIWVGGSPGSADEVLLWAIAAKLGIARDQLKFVAFPGGGEPVIRQLVSDPHAVAIRNIEEFASYAGPRKIRVLAVSTGERFAGIDHRTLREQGLDLVVTDWKGAFLSPQVPAAQRQAIEQVFARVLAGQAWRKELAAHKWHAPASPIAGFAERIRDDRGRISGLAAATTNAHGGIAGMLDLLDRPWRYAIVGFAIAGLLIVAVIWQRRVAKRKERDLLQALEDVRAQIRQDGDEADERRTITQQLADWNLSAAEIEIAWMILKGLQFKEIASVRQTSERTVRQQAQAIYGKSGLPNRASFSAHFLEELRF